MNRPINIKGFSWLGGILLTCLASCKSDHFDAELAAIDYCKCMEKNGSPKNYGKAFEICDDELTKQNRYYRLSKTYLAEEFYLGKVGIETLDSTQKFSLLFGKKINEICCAAILLCPETDGQ